MKSLKRADQEALRAMIPSRDPKKNEKCAECGWPFQSSDRAYHGYEGDDFAYCSPACLQIAEGVRS